MEVTRLGREVTHPEYNRTHPERGWVHVGVGRVHVGVDPTRLDVGIRRKPANRRIVWVTATAGTGGKGTIQRWLGHPACIAMREGVVV
ncbi:hypothetical protein [Parapedobacter tibetensis]|uniref:hypothetical protein n=1 Tax=Parapedobacter tibetensis TaxID=2972951 RepID=UPI00214DD988|nr:hypothetical protein [Parapedobacter tibetensis]